MIIILKAADWSSESVFQRFYYKPTEDPSFGRAVLSTTDIRHGVVASRRESGALDP